MDIFYLLKVLWRKKWLLIIIPLLAAICAFVVKSQLPKSYKSTSQLATGFTVADQINFGDERFSANEAGLKFSNLIEMVKSRIIISLVSYKLLLHDLEDESKFRNPELDPEDLQFISSQKEEIKVVLDEKLEKIELLTSFDPFEKQLMKLLGAYGYDYKSIIDDLGVSRLGLSDFIIIEFLSENPELSAFVVNTATSELIRYNNLLKSSRSGESVEFFQELVAQKKKALDEKSEALRVYKASRNVMNVQVEGESTLSQIRDLEAAREVERQKIYRLELSIQDLNNRIRSYGDGGSSNNQRIIELKDKINHLNARSAGGSNQQIADSLSFYRNELQSLMAIASTSASGGSTREELLQQRSNLQIELTVANSSLQSINSTLNTLKNNVSGYSDTESTVRALEREVDDASVEYANALERFNTAKNTSLVSNTSLKQVIAGQPAGEPESSKTLIITAGAWMASLMLCVFVILGLELLDISIKLPSYFEKATGVPLLGYLNQISKQTDLNDLLTKVNESYELRKFNHLLKKLRYDIEASQSKALLVTSTKEGEGKTFFIVSLAYSLSLINKKVLLVDTNFKNNSLTQIFLSRATDMKALEEHNYVKRNAIESGTYHQETGYTEEEAKDMYSKGIVSKTGIKGINIIGSKGGEYSPAEIFSQKNFHNLIATFSKEYDYIIMEGTSMNEFSDTKELVEYADKVIAVFSAYSKVGSNDYDSIEFLKGLDGKFLGGVLNNVNLEDINES